MKRISLLFIGLILFSINAFSQNDVTKFLGIPVDGFKPDMIQKLKGKGFVSTNYDKDVLTGEFNGYDVNVYVVTNNNKVYRIMISDANTISETDIKIRFNNLCNQFKNNSRYAGIEDYTIPEDEDISYEMSVNNKRYQAIFYQQMEQVDTTLIANELKSILLEKYTEEELETPTEDIQKDILNKTFSYMMDKISMKTVWFMISELYGKYYISMYYDNEYNRSNGEDL